MKIANSVLFSLFRTSNEICNICHTPSTGLSGTLFSNDSNELNDPKGPENIICIMMMYGEMFHLFALFFWFKGPVKVAPFI